MVIVFITSFSLGFHPHKADNSSYPFHGENYVDGDFVAGMDHLYYWSLLCHIRYNGKFLKQELCHQDCTVTSSALCRPQRAVKIALSRL